MSFTPEELRLLRLSDRAESSGYEAGRPRKPCANPNTERRRQQQRDYHQRRKAKRTGT